MAILTNIHTLLSGRVVEWARIEFKTVWDSEASLKTITAFANDIDNWGGGYIVIGVEEKDGIPVKPYKGVPLNKVDEWQKKIYEKCKTIRPAYTPILDVGELDGKKIHHRLVSGRRFPAIFFPENHDKGQSGKSILHS